MLHWLGETYEQAEAIAGAAAAFFIYLIMAVGVLFPNPWLCEIVWKWRFVLDLVVCVWTILLLR